MSHQTLHPTEIAEDNLDTVAGGAETVHLYLKSNGERIDGETARAKVREIVVVGSKVKDVI